MEKMDIEKTKSIKKNKNLSNEKRKKNMYYAKQFAIFDWMIATPNSINISSNFNHAKYILIDFYEDFWYVFSKPDGMRTLVIASGEQTIARSKNGEIILNFHSMLPGG